MRGSSQTLFPHAYSGLGLFLEAFYLNESIMFPLAARDRGSNINKRRIDTARGRSTSV